MGTTLEPSPLLPSFGIHYDLRSLKSEEDQLDFLMEEIVGGNHDKINATLDKVDAVTVQSSNETVRQVIHFRLEEKMGCQGSEVGKDYGIQSVHTDRENIALAVVGDGLSPIRRSNTFLFRKRPALESLLEVFEALNNTQDPLSHHLKGLGDKVRSCLELDGNLEHLVDMNEFILDPFLRDPAFEDAIYPGNSHFKNARRLHGLLFSKLKRKKEFLRLIWQEGLLGFIGKNIFHQNGNLGRYTGTIRSDLSRIRPL